MIIIDEKFAKLLAGSDEPWAPILAGDDWRPMAEYVPSVRYVYAAAYGVRARVPHVMVARQGRGSTTWWYSPKGHALGGVIAWKPLPDDGRSAYEHEVALWGDDSGAFVRPPEPVYPPGDIDVRLTPVPRSLLVAMRDGARMTERSWRWTVFQLHVPGQPPKKLGERAVGGLRRHAFISRDGVLPPGRLPRWFEFDWSITDAGKAWLAANC